MRLRLNAVAVFALLTACGHPPPGALDRPIGSDTSDTVLFDPATVLTDSWQHLRLKGETDYDLVPMNGTVAIRAVGRGSASGLTRRVAVDPHRCPVFEWEWLVRQVQPSARLHLKDQEDVAASVFLLFGDPGFLFDPKPVPTVRYVWTNDNADIGEVIDNPYLPGVVRSIVVQRGPAEMDSWVTERRDVLEDYRRAFNKDPNGPIRAVVLFTDNDQTNEPVEAYYGRGWAECGS